MCATGAPCCWCLHGVCGAQAAAAAHTPGRHGAAAGGAQEGRLRGRQRNKHLCKHHPGSGGSAEEGHHLTQPHQQLHLQCGQACSYAVNVCQGICSKQAAQDAACGNANKELCPLHSGRGCVWLVDCLTVAALHAGPCMVMYHQWRRCRFPACHVHCAHTPASCAAHVHVCGGQVCNLLADDVLLSICPPQSVWPLLYLVRVFVRLVYVGVRGRLAVCMLAPVQRRHAVVTAWCHFSFACKKKQSAAQATFIDEVVYLCLLWRSEGRQDQGQSYFQCM